MDARSLAQWSFRLALLAALVPLGVLATFQTTLEDPVWYVGQAAAILALGGLLVAGVGTQGAVAEEALWWGVGGWAGLRLLGLVLSALGLLGGLDLFSRTVFFQGLALLQALALAYVARALLAAKVGASRPAVAR